jgi:hypothetical protein
VDIREKIAVFVVKLQFKAGSVKAPVVFLDSDGMVIFSPCQKLFEFTQTGKTLLVCRRKHK